MTDASIGWLALSTSLLAASTYNVFAKILSPAFSPLSLVFVSECIVLLSVLLSFGAMPIARMFLLLSKRELQWLAVVGVLGGIVGPTLWFTGLSMTSVVSAGFYGKSGMIFTVAGAWLMLGERSSRTHAMAMCTITAGIALIALRGFTEGLSLGYGDLLIIAGSFSFSFGDLVLRKFIPNVHPHATIASRSSLAILAFLVTAPFIHHTFVDEVRIMSSTLLPALIGFGFISRFINGFMYYEALGRLPVSTVSLVGATDVILSTAVAYAMLGEPVLWYHILGGGFVLLGTLLLETLGTHPTKKALEEHMLRKHR